MTELEQELLVQLWLSAAGVDQGVSAPDDRTLLRTPMSMQAVLMAISNSRFFGRVPHRVVLWMLHQVGQYLEHPVTSKDIQSKVNNSIGSAPLLIVAHSLGTVVAYEVLLNRPDVDVRLVTLGSPLGITKLILDRILSRAGAVADPLTGYAPWPEGVRRWVNVADDGDVIALEKDLSKIFGPRVENITVNNGSRPHDVCRYLTDPLVGAVIADGLYDE